VWFDREKKGSPPQEYPVRVHIPLTVSMSESQKHTALVVLNPGSEEIEFITVADVLVRGLFLSVLE